MFAALKGTWDLLNSKRIKAQNIDSAFGSGFREVRVHEKSDGGRWVTLVARGGNARVYVPLEPHQALALASSLERLAGLAKSPAA